MRILYVQQHFATDRGEAGVRGYRLVCSMVERGHDVTVVSGHNWRDATLIGGRRLVERTERDGFTLVRLGIRYSQHQSYITRIASFLGFSLLASWVAVRRRSDLVYVSSTPLTVAIPALVARVIRRTPYVIEVRDLWPDLPVAMGVIKPGLLLRALAVAERLAYRYAALGVGLAPAIADAIAQRGSLSPGSVFMVPNGADTIGLRPLGGRPRHHLGLSNDLLVLGYAGTHGPANGLDAVLDAAAVLLRRGTSGVAFALIGDGSEKVRLRARAEAEGLTNVYFFDLVDKSSYGEVLAELDVGMQILLNVPAFAYGTSPNKFFDYLAAGRPVLVNYPGLMADIVREHGCGVSITSDDPEAFADAVEGLLEKRHELEAMGAAARAAAEACFDQQSLLPELVESIESYLSARADSV